MYALQIHGLRVQISEKTIKSKKIILEIYSEGHPSRRFFLGEFKSSKTKYYESLVHLTSTPVTIRLSRGNRRYHYLGAYTLVDFLELIPNTQSNVPNSPPTTPVTETVFKDKGELVFGRGEQFTFTVKYSISPVSSGYRFALNEINCLQLVSASRFFTPRDDLFAEVEFNHCPHAIDPGPKNTYNLGSYSSHDTGPIHTTHNCILSRAVGELDSLDMRISVNFTSLTNFSITFIAVHRGLVKNTTSILGTIKLIPLKEVFKHKIEELSETTFTKKYLEETARNESGEEGLLFLKNSSNSAESLEPQEMLLKEPHDGVATKSVIFQSNDGSGTYEFVFTLYKEFKRDPKQSILDFISERDNPFRWLKPPNQQRKSKDKQKELINDSPTYNITINNKQFRAITENNDVELLIDGLETFTRYYEIMMQAQHSIKILAWEISMSFGLVKTSDVNMLPRTSDPNQRWITLEDVLLDRALAGVKVRIVVWRHTVLSYLQRFLYLGEVSIEREMAKLEARCHKLGVSIRVFQFLSNSMPGDESMESQDTRTDIIVNIVGSPTGSYLESHHEKLVLIDSENPERCCAFVGGFDMARGRYDQPAHQIPKPILPIQHNDATNNYNVPRYSGAEIQPFIRTIRFLWHDLHLLVRGPITHRLQLHFEQRWLHAFTRNTPLTRAHVATIPTVSPVPKSPQNFQNVSSNGNKTKNKVYKNCKIKLSRTWKGVFDTHYMFKEFCEMLMSAKNFLYLEQQYPFHTYPLTYLMCQSLKKNPKLRVLIVTPVKTDLMTGLVGNFIDWSHDHIIQHLHEIKRVAPDRVEIYGLVRQDDATNRVKPIYVHSKLAIVDDEWMLTGSPNMDNMSFFWSSEISLSIYNKELARDTKTRLIKEHLGSYFKPEMEKTENFQMIFDAFKEVATQNEKNLRAGSDLVGRPVFMAPAESYELVLKRIYYPNKISKLLYKMGINTEDFIQNIAEAGRQARSYLPDFQRSRL